MFVSAEVLEGVNLSLLSGVMASRLSRGTYNGGLLSTEAGTLARVVADGTIALAGYLGEIKLLNATLLPSHLGEIKLLNATRVNLSLLSRVMPSRLSCGTYNGGLLSTEAGTLARVVADGTITLAGYLGESKLLNATLLPSPLICVTSIIATFCNYNYLY
ncbi:unnamed protein product [Fraxinus pennsylvanica]|uniref:Uncharacterized protein n=1 Tax=Fraxinus pennsylvanica TaxID=56036 RepID=A0AAD1ZZ52_9LAMI|nr:unnamed protein product [Fraxinus pennsylvanica]